MKNPENVRFKLSGEASARDVRRVNKAKGRGMTKLFSTLSSLDFPKSLDKLFLRQRAQASVGTFRTALLIGMAITLLFGGLDYYLIPEIAAEARRIRISLLAVGVAILMLSYSPVLPYFYNFSTFSACLAMLVGSAGIALIVPDPLHWIYYSIGMVFGLWWPVIAKMSWRWCSIWAVTQMAVINIIWSDYHQLGAAQLYYVNLLYVSAVMATLYTVFKSECEGRKTFLVQHKKNLMNFDRSQLEESESRLRFLVVLDSLTGLANKKSFERGIKMEWNRSGRSRNPVGLLRIDIDHFERLTESGSEAVEAICMRFADVIRGYTRRSGDLAAHFQKGRFALLLPDTDLNASFQIANKIKEDIRDLEIMLDIEKEESLTASIGVTAMIPRPHFMHDEIVNTAEEALRRAQSLGQEQIICL